MRQSGTIELPEPLFKLSGERVLRNNWVADVYGNVHAFGDMGPAELVAIEQQVEPYGAVVLLPEVTGAAINLQVPPPATVQATGDQRAVIEDLAKLAPSVSYMPPELNERISELVPTLYLARTAITKGAFLLNASPHVADRYHQVMMQLGGKVDKATYNHSWALERINLSPLTFMKRVAEAVLQAQKKRAL